MLDELRWNVTLRNATSIYFVPEAPNGNSDSVGDLFGEAIDDLPQGLLLGSSKGVFKSSDPTIQAWRNALLDTWMTSWSNIYALPADLPVTSIPGLWLRNRLEQTWIVSDEQLTTGTSLLRTDLQAAIRMESYNATLDKVDCTFIKRK